MAGATEFVVFGANMAFQKSRNVSRELRMSFVVQHVKL